MKRRSSRRRKSTRQGSLGFVSLADEADDEADPATVLEWPFNAETGRVERDSVLLTQGDCNRLREGHFLNDNLIDFYLRFLQRTRSAGAGASAGARAGAAPPRRGTLKVFSSFFYKQLRTGSKGSKGGPKRKNGGSLAFDSVKRWTLNDDIFQYDFLLIPVCQAMHWSLAVVCHPRVAMLRRAAEAKASANDDDDTSDEEEEAAASAAAAASASAAASTAAAAASVGVRDGEAEEEEEELVESEAEKRLQPCILFLDSLGCHKTNVIGGRLRGYLRREWEDKSRSKKHRTTSLRNIKVAEMPDVRLKVPTQSNGCDCGVFVLKYSEYLLRLLETAPLPAPAKSLQRSTKALPLVVSSSSASAAAWHEQTHETNAARADPISAVICILCTVTLHSNHAHNLTRSPSHL